MLDPGIEDRFERVVGGQLNSMALLLALGVGIDVLGQESPGLIAQGARFSQADFRVVAQGDAFLLA